MVRLFWLCFLIVFEASRASEVIQCRDTQDYYHSLYTICTQALPCRHLFHLYPMNAQALENTAERASFVDYRNERDFHLFCHQLSNSPIFRINLPDGVPRLKNPSTFSVLKSALPDAWQPDILIQLNASVETPCSQSGSLSQFYVISALYGMHVYKLTVADEFFCHDPNERLVLNEDNETFCVCKVGKSCENDSNFEELLPILISILIVFTALLIIAIFTSMFYKRRLLYAIEYQQQ